MRLRAASPADAAAIAAVEADSTGHPWSTAQVEASLAHDVGAWVLEDEGRIVGHLLASAQGPEGEVLIVAMHPERRRLGGARALLTAAEAWWRTKGVEEAFLEVRDDNAPARALYGRLGWVQVGRRRAYYRDGTDAIALKKTLRIPG